MTLCPNKLFPIPMTCTLEECRATDFISNSLKDFDNNFVKDTLATNADSVIRAGGLSITACCPEIKCGVFWTVLLQWLL